MRFISTIFAQYYEPDRVHDYYREGTETREVSGWVIVVTLIIAIWVYRETDGGHIASRIFGVLFLSGAALAILHSIDSLFVWLF